MPKKPTNDEHQKEAKVFVQGMCLVALVALALGSGFGHFAVPNVVYAIIAGILFGVGSIKDIFGGGSK